MINKFSDPHMTTQMSLTEVMLELVRAAVLDRDPFIPKDTGIDWDKLMDISQEQGLVAWVYDGICKMTPEQQPPRPYRINWGMSAQDIWDRYEQQSRVLDEMIEICRKNNMRLLLLKGFGLSELYPKPESRPSGDIDIYLFDDYEKGNIIFGDGMTLFNKKHSSFYVHGVHIENHVSPLDTDTEFERKINAYLQSDFDNLCLTSKGYYTFSPMSNMVYLITHSLHHFLPQEAIPLRNILDIILFTRFCQNTVSPKKLYQQLSILGLDRPFEFFIRMGEQLLKIGLPEYHRGLVQEDYLNDMWKYMLKPTPKLIVSDELPFFKQIWLLFSNYQQVRKVYNYLPSKKDNLFFATYCHNVAVPLKKMLKIPDDERIYIGFKKKKSVK